MTVNGVSFISLATKNEQLFTQTVEFYQSLNFKVVRNYSKAPNVESSQTGVAQDSTREVWLESFKLTQLSASGNDVVPLQESNSLQSEGAFIKLRLTKEDSNSATVHYSQLEGCIIFFTTQFDEIKQKFGLVEDKNGLIYLKDPLNNNLGFSSRPTPFTAPVSREYFTSQEKKVEPVKLSAEDEAKSKKKRKLAVMTSGGDSQGMNAVVRAVVRAGIFYECDVFAIYEGYSGLVNGGNYIKKMEWGDVRGWVEYGGTLIGTARCKEFRERWGRLKAAKNMIDNGIDGLIVCGGDGSLTGADLFRAEWPSLLKELVDTKQLTQEQFDKHQHLTIVGLVGSIDNDMSGTDTTIGANSSLERICEMVDYIDATAESHSRAFVIEVMGRHCGWLALNAGIATSADYIFIPERAPVAGEWQANLKSVCQRHREKGRRKTIVIVAEGAIDTDLKPITSEQVKDVLVELGLDTRITTLGHVQRGGTAVASDRMLATLQGVEAVKSILKLTPSDPSPLIGIVENKIMTQPLVESVKLTKSVAQAIENKDFDKAISLRNSDFIESYHNYVSLSQHDDGSQILPEEKQLNIAVVHVGASSAALNAATGAALLYAKSLGHKLFAIQNGFSGLIRHGSIKELSYQDVKGWHSLGGSEIGTNRSLPSLDLGTVAYYFQKYKFDGLIIIGGFEGFRALHELEAARETFPSFNIPMTLIPATVSNNVPGSEYSLGCDTCLNALVTYSDAVKQSASATRRRVFVVEVQGGNSGYVASYIGLVTGALGTYTPEKKINLKVLQEDIALLNLSFKDDSGENRNGRMLVRNENASTVFETELIASIIEEQSHGRFETRTAIPGHYQQGGVPTAVDRVTASRFAIKCVKFIEEWNSNIDKTDLSGSDPSLRFKYVRGQKIPTVKNVSESAAVIGVKGSELTFTSIKHLWENETDVNLRKGLTIHWENLIEASDLLSGRLNLRNYGKLNI